jgi:hypothetical protein
VVTDALSAAENTPALSRTAAATAGRLQSAVAAAPTAARATDSSSSHDAGGPIRELYGEVRGLISVSTIHAEIAVIPSVLGIEYCLEACELNQVTPAGCTHVEVDLTRPGTPCVLRRGPPQVTKSLKGAGNTFFVRRWQRRRARKTLGRRTDVVFAMLAAPQYVRERSAPALATYLLNEDVFRLFEIRRRGAPPNDGSTSFEQFQTPVQTHVDGSVVPTVGAPVAASSHGLYGAGIVGLREVNPFGGSGFVTSAWVAPPQHVTTRSFNGAWKNFAILDLLFAIVIPRDHNASLPDYTVLVDDDSYVLTDTLRWTLRGHDPSVQFMLGLLVTSRGAEAEAGDVTWPMVFARVNNSDHMRPVIPNVQGGAGIVISRAAFVMMLEGEDGQLWTRCARHCRQWAGDIRVGCCGVSLGTARLVYHGGFHHHDVEDALNSNRAVLRTFSDAVTYPVSFHDLRSSLMFEELHTAVLEALGQPIPQALLKRQQNASTPFDASNLTARVGLVAWPDLQAAYLRRRPWYRRRPILWDSRILVA